MKKPDKVFDPVAYLANAGLHRKIVQFKTKGRLLSQGTNADSVFYIQKGRAKLTVVSKAENEATITLLSVGDFVGEESVAAVAELRLATATAITACTGSKLSAVKRFVSFMRSVPFQTYS